MKKRIAIGVLLVLALAAIAYYYGPTIYRVSTDRATLEAFLDEVGLWAPLVFVILMAAQVIFAPIPGMVMGLVGGYVFGSVQGFLLNLIGLLIGAMLAFALARYFGKPLVDRMVGPNYGDLLARINGPRGVLIVGVIFLLPFMPDDALCFLAALTPMRTRLFAFLVLVCRTPGLIVASLTGAGVIDLPLQAWLIVGVAAAIALLVAWWRREELERWTGMLLDAIGGH